MEHIYNLNDSFFRYFKALEQMGYYDKNETKNLIIYLFIVNEVFKGRLSEHLDDEGLAQFEKVLRCLYNGCLINGVREGGVFKTPDSYRNNTRYRYSEILLPRISEDEDLRIPETID